MVEIREVFESRLKMEITDKVLRALPEWFGIESSVVDYVNNIVDLPFWAVFDKDIPIGFLALKIHNSLHAEFYVLGILKDYHRQSIGRELFNTVQNYCIDNYYKYISVKTLDSTHSDVNYAKTRKFYEGIGFKPFEVHETLWGKSNPCLVMIKDLKI